MSFLLCEATRVFDGTLVQLHNGSKRGYDALLLHEILHNLPRSLFHSTLDQRRSNHDSVAESSSLLGVELSSTIASDNAVAPLD